MCHPYPGPRCSNHAYKEFLAALKKFEDCADESKKISFGKLVDEKTVVLDSTPRGHSRLRQQINATEAPTEKLLLQRRLLVGEATRKEQTESWRKFLDTRNMEVTSVLKDQGVKNKYDLATGLTLSKLYKLVETTEGISLAVEDDSTIMFSTPEGESTIKLLALPAKYQHLWGSIGSEDTDPDNLELSEVLKTNVDYTDLDEADSSKVFSWFNQELKKHGYLLASSVNPTSEEITLLSAEEIKKQYSIGLKLRKRLGGTTFFRGDPASLADQLKGTAFAGGKIEQIGSSPRITILSDVPQLPKKDCFISETLYLSWSGDGYYQARQRYVSKASDVFIMLKRTKDLPAGMSEEARVILDSFMSSPDD